MKRWVPRIAIVVALLACAVAITSIAFGARMAVWEQYLWVCCTGSLTVTSWTGQATCRRLLELVKSQGDLIDAQRKTINVAAVFFHGPRGDGRNL